jgi:hypothetical protein
MQRPLLRLLLLAHSFGYIIVLATTVQVPSITTTAGADSVRRSRHATRGGSLDVASPKILKRFGDNARMPSLFTPEEGVYDKYAACLAATEGLRRLRDQDLAVELQRAGGASLPSTNEGQQHISAQYVQNAGKVLHALGMSVSQFNDLGRQIAQDELLKGKVSSGQQNEMLVCRALAHNPMYEFSSWLHAACCILYSFLFRFDRWWNKRIFTAWQQPSTWTGLRSSKTPRRKSYCGRFDETKCKCFVKA